MDNKAPKDTQNILYSPLNNDADDIRLLTLARTQSGSPLQCHLSTVSLRAFCPAYTSFINTNGLRHLTIRQAKTRWAPSSVGDSPQTHRYRFHWGDFAALSYVWGDESARTDVIINGETVPITANLELALRTLASEEGIFSDRYKLWVDAICINQADEKEQAQQVQKMRDIYSGAWNVISWIGCNNPAIKGAFSFLRMMASLEHDQLDLSTWSASTGNLFRANYFLALRELMKQDYWFRLWIIQELVMGASSTVLRYGDETIDWNTFSKGIGVLYHGSNWTLKDREVEAALVSRGIREDVRWHTYGMHLIHVDLGELTRAEEQGTQRLGFRRLLDIADYAGCRYVRDKVFGLVGLMDPAIAAEIMKAYGFPEDRLFAAVAKAFIVRTNSLEALRQGNPWGYVGSPSWAADWTWRRIRFSRPEYKLFGPPWDPSEPEPDPASIFSADRGMTPSFQFLDRWRFLQCDGFTFDEIAGLGAPEHGFFNWDRHRVVPCPSWRSAYGGYEATASALWNTLLLSTIDKGKRAQPRHAALLHLPINFWTAFPQFEKRGWTWLAGQRAYYFKWEEWHKAHDDMMLGDWPLGKFFKAVIPKGADELTFTEVYCASQRTVQQRRFMLTKGGYFGWGPDNVYGRDKTKELRAGDKIAIVSGCSTPLVIRPRGKEFEVLGEAYVQGFMDGEAVDLLESGVCQRQTFTFY
ncbi:hypothetical protein OQA88_7054 [Cercophora sp. LCS_1]